MYYACKKEIKIKLIVGSASTDGLNNEQDPRIFPLIAISFSCKYVSSEEHNVFRCLGKHQEDSLAASQVATKCEDNVIILLLDIRPHQPTNSFLGKPSKQL